MEKEVPQAVKDEASWLIDTFGDSFEYLGVLPRIKELGFLSLWADGTDVYIYKFPSGKQPKMGFPSVYLYKDGKAITIDDFLALDIISLFRKDT